MIGEHTHRATLRHCGGPSTLLAQLRKTYWIIGGGANLCKKIIGDCNRCFFLNMKPPTLPTPPMHASRLANPRSLFRAFAEIGVDMAGPFTVKIGRTTHKRYLMLLVCCATRALNTEICHSLTSSSCLMALERHSAKMGRPHYINSDRGTNFIGVANHLEEKFAKKHQANRLWTENITWWFNPADSPTWDGSRGGTRETY